MNEANPRICGTHLLQGNFKITKVPLSIKEKNLKGFRNEGNLVSWKNAPRIYKWLKI